jgi:hypothetical protein
MNRHGEDILLFLAALGEMGEGEFRHAAEIIESGPDWDYLAGKAEILGVSAGPKELLSRTGGVPGRIAQSLQKAVAVEFTRTEIMQSFYSMVVSLMDGHDICFVPLKGCDARIAQGSRRLTNPMEDIDILVRQEDLFRVRDILERNGFLWQGAHSGAHLNFAHETYPPRFLEVHWDLVNRESPFQRHLFHPDIPRIWKDCIVLCDRLHLSAEDLLCYTTAHAFKEYFRKPKWAADALYLFRQILPGLDSGKLRERVEEWGVGTALGVLAETLMAVTGDREFENVFQKGAKRPDIFGKHASAGFFRWDGARMNHQVAYLACAGTFGERISLLACVKELILKKYFT